MLVTQTLRFTGNFEKGFVHIKSRNSQMVILLPFIKLYRGVFIIYYV